MNSVFVPYTYEELLEAQRLVEEAEYVAARARRDRDRVAEALHAAGVPITHLAKKLGLTQAALSFRLIARRREMVLGESQHSGQDETTTKGEAV